MIHSEPIPEEVIEQLNKCIVARSVQYAQYDMITLSDREKQRFEENKGFNRYSWNQRLVNKIFMVNKKHVCDGSRIFTFEFKSDIKSWRKYVGKYYMFKCECGNKLVAKFV